MSNDTKNTKPLRRSIRVTFSDGDTITTGINGTVQEIEAYYIGKRFNLGRAGDDYFAIATKVEFLD